MSQEVKKKKIVSFSQFSNWWECPYRWYRDFILHEKSFEDNLIMTFGTGVHEAIQLYIRTLFDEGEEKAEALDLMDQFVTTFKREIAKKKISHTQEEFDEFVEDGRNILTEFREPANRLRYFPRDKWELLAIEDELKEDIRNNVVLDAKLDLVLKEKLSGDIRIIDIKTSNIGWTNYAKEDFTKTSQLVLYKALYSKKYNIPLNQIHVEFFILKRKLYDPTKVRYEQSRIQVFKPSSFQKDVLQVIQEFGRFVDACFTSEGVHNTQGRYPKVPGKNQRNCRFCPYFKNGKCNGIADIL